MPQRTTASLAIVADDSALMRDILRSNLSENFGYVHLASDGLEAVEAARGLQAGLVMLDYRMGRLNGIDACREIRTLPGYAAVPIVLLTAYDDDKLRREATRAGVTLVCAKPVIFDQLMEQLAPHLAAPSDPAPTANGLARGRDLLAQRRRIEAETANAKRRYIGMAESGAPLLGGWRR